MPFLRENDGRWSPEKILAFAVAVVPAIWLAARLLLDDLGPRPVTEAIHFSGRWSVRLLLLTLLMTPLRRLLPAGKPHLARRTLGVGACLYAVVHFLLYVVDQKYDLATVATEIVLRVYLAIGFVALVLMIALGVTSTDAAMRRLGRRWATLHKATYAIAVLGIVHFMLQKKLDIYEPTLMAGLLLWLLLWRLALRVVGRVGFTLMMAISIAAALLTAALEAIWYRAMTGLDPLRILEANLMFAVQIRPAWWVFGAGLAATLVQVIAQRLSPQPRRRDRAVSAASR